ncbi:hypothetical protein C7212DRAFT_363595 [Tuber magnatum]|uniref:Uncharacterized protein n=1 Tax=Tuber magnatum TaxID=42249 RepID=A0A317STG5_9PEZI|nr:hypothetical protein C7212DRAFT_363595 [Tuber magnatum]
MDLLIILTSMSRVLLLSPALFIFRLVTAAFLPVIIIGNYLTSLELYIFCGVAAVIGISTGAILGLASYFLTDTLDFRDEPAVPGAVGQTRLTKERIKSAAKNTTTTATTAIGTANTRVPARVLSPQAIPTILEEEDEDSPFLVGSSGGGGKRREGRVRRATGWSSEDEGEEREEGEIESSG